MSMDHVNLFLQQDAFRLRVVGEEVGKYYIGSYDGEGKIVGFNTLYQAYSAVLWRVAMSDDNYFVDPVPEEKT